MEAAIESMSFQLQAPLQIEGIHAIDVTPPVAVGDEREWSQMTAFPLRRYAPASIQMQGIWTAPSPDLTVPPAPLDRRHRAALDWSLKAIAAAFQIDQFMFLWIAFEILSDLHPEFQVTGPLKVNCGHEIASCPQCDRATTRPIQGPTRQRFLTDGFGIEPDTARELWKARQIMHGAEEFDSAVMDRLAELNQILRAVVNHALKLALGIGPNEPPVVQFGQFAIAPHIGLDGTGEITETDLTPSPRDSGPPHSGLPGRDGLWPQLPPTPVDRQQPRPSDKRPFLEAPRQRSLRRTLLRFDRRGEGRIIRSPP